MLDEASTFYVDMLDQTTLGHRFIKKEFGKAPRIGWQIDPFGHSAVQSKCKGLLIFPFVWHRSSYTFLHSCKMRVYISIEFVTVKSPFTLSLHFHIEDKQVSTQYNLL